jgi:signal transduction histidine kinase
MRDPLHLSHAELVAEVHRLRALLALRQPAAAGDGADAAASHVHKSEALSLVGAELGQALGAPAEAVPAILHELRTALTVVLGLIEALNAGVYGPLNERQRQALDLAERSGGRLVALLG